MIAVNTIVAMYTIGALLIRASVTPSTTSTRPNPYSVSTAPRTPNLRSSIWCRWSVSASLSFLPVNLRRMMASTVSMIGMP